MVPVEYYFVLSALLFFIGVFGFVTRRNLIAMLISIELILNAVDINFAAFNRMLYPGEMEGMFFTLFSIGESAAESAVANAIIINVARGGIINEDDLYDALNSKEIAGAAIDCVCKEPMLPKHKLFTLDNYIATPHMAWYSEEASQELKRKVAEECVNFLKHSFVRYPINHLK